MESQASRIGVEQSQADRSKRHYEPLQYVNILFILQVFFTVKFLLSKFARLIFLVTARPQLSCYPFSYQVILPGSRRKNARNYKIAVNRISPTQPTLTIKATT